MCFSESGRSDDELDKSDGLPRPLLQHRAEVGSEFVEDHAPAVEGLQEQDLPNRGCGFSSGTLG